MNLKKTIKIVGLFMVVFTVVIAAVTAGYILINKNRTYYIYDVRIVEPVEDSRYYIYSAIGEDDEEIISADIYSKMENKVVYLTNGSSNLFEIAVYVHTDNNSTGIEIESSNKEVADKFFRNGHCYIEYKKAGKATITASLGGVFDKIDVTVFDNTAESFTVYDDVYYGEKYEKNFPNNIISYADDKEYHYRYEVSEYNNNQSSKLVNTDNIRVVDYDKSLFKNVDMKYVISEDQGVREIVPVLSVECRSEKLIFDDNGNQVYLDENKTKPKTEPITEDNDTAIFIESFSSEGDNISPAKNFVVNVHIIADTPKYLQMLLSTTPAFEDESVYVYTEDYNDFSGIPDKSVIEKILENQKEKTYLVNNSEKDFYNAYFTDKVSTIYFKIRKIYTNGNIVYLNPNTFENHEYNLIWSKGANCKPSYNNDYYILRYDEEYFKNNEKIEITIEIYGINPKTFEITYKPFLNEYLSDSSKLEEYVNLFYSKDNNGIYTYSYWDPRARFDNEVYDSDCNIVGFAWPEPTTEEESEEPNEEIEENTEVDEQNNVDETPES